MEQKAYESIKKFLYQRKEENQSIDPNEMLSFIETLEFHDPGLRDYRLMKFESRNSRFIRLLDDRKAMFDAVITTATMALKSALLINGGACIAVMGLIAGVMKENSQSVYAFELNVSLAWFGFGVFSGALASAVTYFAQYYYSEYVGIKGKEMKDKAERLGNRCRLTAILLAFSSYGAFLAGLYKGYLGLP